MAEANVANLEEWQKYIVLLIDEMKIKEDLIYDKGTGELIGFTNVGDISNHLHLFETALANSASKEPQLATSMPAFMVRGIFTHLAFFPYAHFLCTNLTVQTLYPLVWEVVGRLEALGLKVLVLTADGAGPNHKLFHMHQAQGQVEKVTDIIYKTPNPYSDDGRDVYFISDVPHLIKTTHNCWTNEKRHLWVSNKYLMLN